MGIRRWFFAGDHFNLTSPLPVEECVDRLHRRTVPTNELLRWAGAFPTLPDDLSLRPLRGKVTEDTFRIARRVVPYGQGSFAQYRLTFATWLDGAFRQEASATRISVTTRVFRGMGCFLWAIAGVAILIGMALTATPSAWPALLIPVFFVAIPVMGRLAAAGDTAFLLSVLETTLEATQTPMIRPSRSA